MARLLWTQKQHVGPRARLAHALAFDSRRLRTILFGGTTSGVRLGDTWSWDGENWTQLADLGPRPRSETAMVYDAARDRVVLFGGFDGNAVADTWEFDGEDWTQMADTGPAPRLDHAMAFDAARGRVVLFGGDSFGGPLFGDTWQWDGNEWVQVEDTGPSARRGAAMAFDATRGRVVLFGGSGGASVLGDTWEWDGTVWTQTSAFGPPACMKATLVHTGRRALLFGGVTGLIGTTEVFGQSWEWDGRHWTARQDLGPGARWGHAMAFDTPRGRGVLFGGTATPAGAGTEIALGDTWEQFEQGAQTPPPPPPPPPDVTVASVAVVRDGRAEGLPIVVEATLSAAPPAGTEVVFGVQDSAGNDLSGPINVDAGGSATVRTPAFALAAGSYVVTASVGASQATAPVDVTSLGVALASFTASPANLPAGASLTLTATLPTPLPGPGGLSLMVPLRVGIAGQPGGVWFGQQLVINAGQATGSVDLQLGLQAGTQITWTAMLGGATLAADVTAV